jgi:TonB-dependent SusC/RagA subfamily outer membrane receptor
MENPSCGHLIRNRQPSLMRSTLLICFIALLIYPATAQHNFYSMRWSDVYKYEVKDLPQSALRVVDSIYSRAKKEGNITELTKSLLYQSKFALILKENSEVEVVEKFKKEIKVSKAPLKNLLESMLAQIYWQHFQRIRWKYYNRSTIADTANAEDFRTWDAGSMLREIDHHFKNSLSDVSLLQSTRLEKFDDILALAENSKRYRPTLYDFLANNALDFYRTNEIALQAPDTTATDDDDTPPDDAPQINDQAHAIFNGLLQFHEARRDTNAYVSIALERLKYMEEESSRYSNIFKVEGELKTLKSRFSRHPASTQIDLDLATLLLKREYDLDGDTTYHLNKKPALDICNAAILNFPGSDGAARCKVLKEHILSKDLSITTEKFIPVSKPSRLKVNYTNIDKLFISVYRITGQLKMRFFSDPQTDSAIIALTSTLTPEKSWSADLVQMGDYREHSTELVIPSLANGNYLIVASEKSTGDAETIFAFTTVHVTDMGLLQITNSNRNEIRFQVINRNNGQPIAGADVHLFSMYPDEHEENTDEHETTDRNGFVSFDRLPDGSLALNARVTHDGDTIKFEGLHHYNYKRNHKDDDEPIEVATFVFTDRSIYRPGQTVFFKGILIKTVAEKSSVVPGQYVDVILEDVDGKEVGSKRLKTNSFGSVSGEFKLPNNGLTGEYTLYADEDVEEDSKFWEDASLQFEYHEQILSVEEYKRPTFEVTFKPVTGTYKVNDSISVTGTAAAYSASKLSKAKVKYTVKRDISYTFWDYRRIEHDYSQGAEITHGETYTDENGEFEIVFKAAPDDHSPAEQRPVFHYKLTADVTDINGETRSANEMVNVGYHSMVANLDAPARIDLQQPASTLKVSTENLNGQFLPATGTIKIYKLQGPESPVRKRPWPAPDAPLFSKEEFRKLFPNDSYADDQSNSSEWSKGKLVKELSFDTKKSKELKFETDKSWQAGAYVMELLTADSTGQEVSDTHQFTIVNSTSKQIADNELLVFESDKAFYKPGEIAKITVGSAVRDVYVTIEVEKNNKITKTYVERLDGSSREISIPVTDVNEGAFSVHCHAAIYNSIERRQKRLVVQSDREKFEIETETFKDKIQPGAKETWSFIISGDPAKKLEAEVLASMYDASLDQFLEHRWFFNPETPRYDYSQYYLNDRHSFGTTDFQIRNTDRKYLNIPQQYYDTFDWFGFSLADSENAKRRYLQRLYYAATVGKPSKVSMSHDKNGRMGFISGRLTSSDGEPLPGVNVLVKGTTNGTVTDMDGRYAVAAGKGDVLVFSFVGFVTSEIKPGRKNVIDVMMENDVTQLSEVVVNAFGIQVERKELGSAVTFATSNAEGEVFFEEAVAGRAAGVQLSSPFAMYNVVLRGSSGLPDHGQKVLYVVDGVVVESSTIEETDLENVQVLKGAAAIALYGSRAANGVIIITTKSGQEKIDNELAKVKARKNFNETAFFFPHLSTDENGRIRFSFTTPESLTRWKLQLLAHTRDLTTTTKTLQAVTQKDLMVTPNAPRFLRVGDEITISAKVANLSNKKLDGKITLQLSNAVTGTVVDPLFGNVLRNQTFKIAPRGTTEVSWKLKVPSSVDAVQYKVVAKAGTYSDGEQNILPVLSNRMLVTESIPMYVRTNQSKTFKLDKLQNHSSSTLQHHQLTLELTSNPAWYAIQSLPYLMEFPHECAEQLFARYYANSIASHIVNSKPKIKEVFEKWSGSGELASNLEKNADLKSILIEETPWIRDAQSETEKKKRVAFLFDLNAMSDQLTTTANKLKEMQFHSGGFPWFSGSRDYNRYITQYIATGFGHLNKLKIKSSGEMEEMITKSVRFLDHEIAEDFKELKLTADASAAGAKAEQRKGLVTQYMDNNVPSLLQVQYLYMRSNFPQLPYDEKTGLAIQHFLQQTGEKWRDYNLYTKAMIACIHFRNGNAKLSREIMNSLKENAIMSEELGMYWKDNTGGWYWHESAVETQALLIEAFAEIDLENAEKQKTIDELRVWLLKHKQTNAWRTTKATTEAAYALLLTGTDWLSIENGVDVRVGGQQVKIDAGNAEAGTGYFKNTWSANAITPAMSTVNISTKNQGIAWGGIYWQYFEDLDKITRADSPLKLKKKVYKVNNTDKGAVLLPLEKQTLHPGDLLRIRIELMADRPMEFLHMKDMRAAGFEPVDVLSSYKWQEGLGYYQSTRDASTNFFFDYLPKGIYVFEYDLRVNNIGNFSNGITTIQSMYAPEFGSHSEGIRVVVE